MGYHYESAIRLTEEEMRLIRRVSYLLDVIYNNKKELNNIKEGLREILDKANADWLYVEGLLEFCCHDDGKIELRRHR